MSEGATTWLHQPQREELPPEVLEFWERPLDKLGFAPNVLRSLALRPSRLLLWNAHFEDLITGDSGLSRPECELIAVVVSVPNRCDYSSAAHSAALRKLTRDPAPADAVETLGR